MNDLIQILEKSVKNYSFNQVKQELEHINLNDWCYTPKANKIVIKKVNQYNNCEITFEESLMRIMLFHLNDLKNTNDIRTNAFVFIQKINQYTWTEVKKYLSKLM